MDEEWMATVEHSDIQNLVGIGICARKEVIAQLVKEGHLAYLQHRGNVGFGAVKMRVISKMFLHPVVLPASAYAPIEAPVVSYPKEKQIGVERSEDDGEDTVVKLLAAMKKKFFTPGGEKSETLKMYLSECYWKGSDEDLNALLFRFCGFIVSTEAHETKRAINGDTSKLAGRFGFWLSEERAKLKYNNDKAGSKQIDGNGGSPARLLDRARSAQWFVDPTVR